MSDKTNGKKPQKAKRPPFHEEFASKIIERLQEGTAPWQVPWTPGKTPMIPHNPASGTVYRGMNRVHLSLSGYDDPRWMTLKQANDNGYSILPGSKATPVVYFQFSEDKNKLDKDGKLVLDAGGKPVKEKVELDKPIVRFAHVFNAAQVDGIPPLQLTDKANEWEPVEKAENILAASGADIRHDQSNRAFYRLMEDAIHLPPKENFDAPNKYYATALHELGHWTGEENRLNREFGPFGSEKYAREELRAEIASWMLGQEIGIGHDPGQHAAYVQSWIKALKEDPYEIVRACRDAEKIKEYVFDLERKKELRRDAPEQVVQPEKAAQRGKSLEKEEGIAAMGLPTDTNNNGPVFVVEIPDNAPPRVWEAYSHDAFYRSVDRKLEEEGLGATAYKKSTLAQEFSSLGMAGESLQQFMANYGLPPDLQPDSPLYIAEYIPTNQNTAFFHLEDPGKFEAYKAACLHDVSRGHVAEGLQEGIELLKQFKESPQIQADLVRVMGLSEQELGQIQNVAKEKSFPLNNLPPVEKVRAFAWADYSNPEPRFSAQVKRAGMGWDHVRDADGKPVMFGTLDEAHNFAQQFVSSPMQDRSRMTLSPQEEFARALEEMGLDLRGKAPIMDGQIHRVPLIGKSGGDLDGAYCGYLDGRPAGWMQNFSAGEKHTWVATGHTLTKEQVEAQRADFARKREERQRQILQRQQQTARDAFTEWIASDYASNDHPYLKAKGVPAFGLREDIDGALLVPVVNVDKELRGLQTISPDGEKRFMYGMEKYGNFHMIGDYGLDHPGVTPFDDEGRNLSQGEILLAEGYATAATLHMATEKPVAVAFDAGNLEPVAKKLREKFPNAAITICADNDHQHTRRTPEGVELWNKGVELAQRAAQEVGGKVVAPIFTDEERARGLTDFNDLHQSRGLDEIKRQVGLVLQKDFERGKSRDKGQARELSL